MNRREYWVITENGNDKIDILDLGMWERYEWSDIKTLKRKNERDPVTFDTRKEAREFVLSNFDDFRIEPELVNSVTRAPEGYAW